jgi:hypothetical protein
VSVDGSATVNPNFDDGGDINFTYSSPNITGAVKANTITNGKLRQSAALSVIGNSSNGTADPADIRGGFGRPDVAPVGNGDWVWSVESVERQFGDGSFACGEY